MALVVGGVVAAFFGAGWASRFSDARLRQTSLVLLLVIGVALIVEAFLPADVTGFLPRDQISRAIAGVLFGLAYIRGNLDATRVETGYCFKPLKMECPFVEIACFTCHNHVTTTDFLPQFQRRERDLLEQIDLGTAASRPHWLDKNQKKLRAVQAVISALEQQRVHGLTKAQREYGPADRARLDAERVARVAG